MGRCTCRELCQTHPDRASRRGYLTDPERAACRSCGVVYRTPARFCPCCGHQLGGRRGGGVTGPASRARKRARLKEQYGITVPPSHVPWRGKQINIRAEYNRGRRQRREAASAARWQKATEDPPVATTTRTTT